MISEKNKSDITIPYPLICGVKKCFSSTGNLLKFNFIPSNKFKSHPQIALLTSLQNIISLNLIGGEKYKSEENFLYELRDEKYEDRTFKLLNIDKRKKIQIFLITSDSSL